MRNKVIVFVVLLATSMLTMAEPEAGVNNNTDAGPEAKAKADYEASEKEAGASEAALGPLREAMQKADVAYAEASKTANSKRNQAADAKNLAGEQGVKDMEQAEANLEAADKALVEATNAKPPLDKALDTAKADAAPLQKIYDEAEKAAREAEAAAKTALDAANKLDIESNRATAQATAKRRLADTAKAALDRTLQAEQNLQKRAGEAPKKVTEAETLKKQAEEALANAGQQAAAARTTLEEAEKAALEAEANAKEVSQEQKQQAESDAAAKRKAADAARAILAEAQQRLQQAQAFATAATQNLAEAPVLKKAADTELAEARKRTASASKALEVIEQTAKNTADIAKQAATDSKRSETEKKQAADEATAWQNAAEAARAALSMTQQTEKAAQAKADTTTRNLADAPEQKKAADAALDDARNKMAAADSEYQSVEKIAREAEAIARLTAELAGRSDEQKLQAAAEATGKRKAAETAKEALSKARAAEKKSQKDLSTAEQKLSREIAQKKLNDVQLVNVKKQATAATTAYQTAEQAAQAAEKTADEKKQAAVQAAAKRKAATDSAAALAQARQNQQQAQAQVTSAVKALADATAKKNSADKAYADIRNQVTLATTAAESAEKAAHAAKTRAEQIAKDTDKPDAEKKQASDEATAWDKTADSARSALNQTQQIERNIQAQAAAAAQELSQVQGQKESTDQVLAEASTKATAAATANQAAQEAAGELIQLDLISNQASTEAAAKRKAANEAKANLDPKAKVLEKALSEAQNAAQALTRAQNRKKSAEDRVANLTKSIASAKQTHVTDEEAAKAAEAAAVPLKAEAEKTRAAYLAARKIADDKRALAQQAKTVLYRLVAARQMTSLMESPEPAEPANRIDEIVFARLKELGIKSALCSDAVFLRRAYLDVTGTLPSAEEAKAFIQSTDKSKRITLIDNLLDRSSHTDYWAMKWGDILRIKAEFPVKVWPNAAQAYHRWVWESIARNKSYDQFAREMLTSSGSNFRVGSVNFYRAIQNKTPEGIAQAVGLVFMGSRIHSWPEEPRSGMTVFFSQVGYKPTSEWKEEIVFWDPLNSVSIPGSIAPGIPAVDKSVTATNQIPQTLANPLSPNGPLETIFPDGTKATIPPDRDPREVFADWLIRPENPWFAKAIVNRTWAWAMGRGIIHEPDDIRQDNPPGNPELLAYLEKELISSNYNLKHLKRLIFTSTVYQLSSIPRHNGPEAGANFASYVLRRVEAEVLIDALVSITGSSDLYTSAVPEPFTYIPDSMSAVSVADGSITSSFLTLFGRSARATGMESERVNELASPQWLHMLNSGPIQAKLQRGPKLIQLIRSGGQTNEIAERLYLTILSRFPTDADIKAAQEYADAKVARGNDVWIDLSWALVNSPEFLLRH